MIPKEMLAIATKTFEAYPGPCTTEEAMEAALTAALSLLWHPLPPKDTWLRTRREGEDGENVCMLPSFNDDGWIERDGGPWTVTHHSFAAPTHWQYPPKENP